MSDREEKIKEIIELLKIWYHLRNSYWPHAKAAIEERINSLSETIFDKVNTEND